MDEAPAPALGNVDRDSLGIASGALDLGERHAGRPDEVVGERVLVHQSDIDLLLIHDREGEALVPDRIGAS